MKMIVIAVSMLLAVAAIGAGWILITYGGQGSTDSVSMQPAVEPADVRFTKGNPEAPVKIVEYADVLCPYCARANAEILPSIQSDYIDTDEAQYELRLVGMVAPDSMRAAEGAYCAGEHGRFWEYIDTAYKTTWTNYYSEDRDPEDVPLFSKARIGMFARRVGITDSLEHAQWQQCVDSRKYRDIVEKHRADMRQMEAYGTPHFNINGKNYNGNPPYSIFKGVIDASIGEARAGA